MTSPIASSADRSRRDTCIWLTPISSGDLGLGEVVQEPQAHDLTLARRQVPHRASNLVTVADGLKAGLLDHQRRHRPGIVIAVVAALFGQGLGDVGTLNGQRFLDLVVGAPSGLSQFLDGGLAAELVAELLRYDGQRAAQLLERTGHAHGPAAVTEEVHDLALDRAGGVRLKRHASGGVVPVDGLDQAQVAALEHVVVRHAAPCEPAGDRTSQPRVAQNQCLSGRVVALLTVGHD